MGSAVSPMGFTMADQEGNLPKLTNCTHSEKSAFRAKVHRLSQQRANDRRSRARAWIRGCVCSTLSLGTGAPRPRPNPATPNRPGAPVKAEHVAAGALGTSDSAGRSLQRRSAARGSPSPGPGEAPAHQGGAQWEGSSPKEPVQPHQAQAGVATQVSRSPRETAQGMQAAPGSQQPCVDGVSRVGKGPRVSSPRMEEQAGLQPRSTTWCRATALLTPFLSEWVTDHLARLEGERWWK